MTHDANNRSSHLSCSILLDFYLIFPVFSFFQPSFLSLSLGFFSVISSTEQVIFIDKFSLSLALLGFIFICLWTNLGDLLFLFHFFIYIFILVQWNSLTWFFIDLPGKSVNILIFPVGALAFLFLLFFNFSILDRLLFFVLWWLWFIWLRTIS